MTLIDHLLPAHRAALPLTEEERESRLLRSAAHDPAAFAPLYEAYAPRIYAYCLRRVNSVSDAEDLTSAVFARALENAPRYKGGMVAAWLFRIARSLVMNHFRAKPTTSLDRADEGGESIGEFLAAESLELLDQVVQDEQRRTLRRLIAALPDHERDLLALRIAAGLSAEAVGAILNLNAGAVRTRTHRLIARLRDEMRRHYPDEEIA